MRTGKKTGIINGSEGSAAVIPPPASGSLGEHDWRREYASEIFFVRDMGSAIKSMSLGRTNCGS